jgi:hypothetical protein
MRLVGLVAALITVIVGLIGTVVLLGALMAFPVMWLWNSLFVYYPILGTALVEINFWQAWGLLILCGLLFKNPSSSSSSK